MSSSQILELADYIHHDLAKEGDVAKPFGGKQIIIIGEFVQLPLVLNVLKRVGHCMDCPYSCIWRITRMN